MAVCPFCNREATIADSCSVESISDDVSKFPRVPVDRVSRKTGRCPDCGAKKGGFHHFGCDQDKCPGCEGQFITCGCFDHVFEDEDDEDDE